ncbi:MAG: hypothetical protein ACP5D7_03635 [Limnospira sp.]
MRGPEEAEKGAETWEAEEEIMPPPPPCLPCHLRLPATFAPLPPQFPSPEQKSSWTKVAKDEAL